MKNKSNIKALVQGMISFGKGLLSGTPKLTEYLEKISDAYRDIEEDAIADNLLAIIEQPYYDSLKPTSITAEVDQTPANFFPNSFVLQLWTDKNEPVHYWGISCLALFEKWIEIRSRPTDQSPLDF